MCILVPWNTFIWPLVTVVSLENNEKVRRGCYIRADSLPGVPRLLAINALTSKLGPRPNDILFRMAFLLN
jgi:hypothetical protein